MKQKLEGSNASISKEVQNNVKLGQEMKKLYYEIMNLSDFIQEPSKLKTSVKVI